MTEREPVAGPEVFAALAAGDPSNLTARDEATPGEPEPTFGRPDHGVEDAGARPLRQLKCATQGCPSARPEVPPTTVHEDTVQPVLCGQCRAVLLCDHEPGDETETVGGTLSQPVTVHSTRCRRCGAVTSERTVPREPVALEDLPMSVLHQLGVPVGAPSAGV